MPILPSCPVYLVAHVNNFFLKNIFPFYITMVMWINFFFFKMSSRLMHNQFLLPINFKLYIIIKKSNINVYVFVLIFILFNECKYIYFLDILYNKDIIVNLYKLHFPSSHFSLQLNKKVFHPLTFPPLQPNTHEEKPNLFYPLDFSSSY